MRFRHRNIASVIVVTVTTILSVNTAARADDPVSCTVWGANLPWGNYGYDIGLPAGGGAHEGFSSVAGRARLETLLSKRQNSVVRVWLFSDLRAGVNFNPDGSLSFRDEATVYADMDALLAVAASNKVRVLAVLFDRTLSVEGDVGTAQVGRHPEVITNTVKRAALISLFDDHFIGRYVNNPNIYGWDVLNEPEVAPEVRKGIVTNEQQWDFIRQFAAMIKGKLAGSGAGQLLTTGNKDRKYLKDMLLYWQGQGYTNGLSLYEFHYYNAMGKSDLAPLNAEERRLVGNVPVLIGEVSSASEQRHLGSNTWTEITEKMDYIAQNGFAGGLFWHDTSLNNTNHDDRYLSPTEWGECTNWTPRVTRTWYASGRRESKIFKRPDFNGAVYYHYADTDTQATGYGRIDVAVYGEPGYEGAVGLEYEYPTDPVIACRVHAYPEADYSAPGNPLLIGSPTTFTYYTNGNIGGIVYPYQKVYTIRWDNGSYSTHTSEVTEASGKAYIFQNGDYDWNDRYEIGNYVGYRASWNDPLELYGGILYVDTPEYQSLYEYWKSDDAYHHIVGATYHRTGPGWPAGQSVDPSAANHPLVLDAILLRPHIDPLSEIVAIYEVTATHGPNGGLSPSGPLLVPHGVTIRFAVAAGNHYHIESIRTNNAMVTDYTFGNGFTNTTFIWSRVIANGSFETVFAENLWTNNTSETWLAMFYPGRSDYGSLALSDTDGDGLDAWQEYWAGTDPTQKSSTLAFTSAWFNYGTNRVEWLSYTNWSTSPYTLLRCTNLVERKWETVNDNIPRTPPTNVYYEATPYPNVPVFYRVAVTNSPQETP